MKRTIAVFLAALMVLALAACGQERVTETTPETAPQAATAPDKSATAPTAPPAPSPTPVQTIPAAVILDRVGAVVKHFDLGEEVKIAVEDEDFYTLSDGLLVEKWLVRLDTENAPDLRSVYAKNNEAALYDNPYCEGEPILKLKYDQKLNVLDAMGAVLRVTVEDSTNGGTKTAEGYVLVTGTINVAIKCP